MRLIIKLTALLTGNLLARSTSAAINSHQAFPEMPKQTPDSSASSLISMMTALPGTRLARLLHLLKWSKQEWTACTSKQSSHRESRRSSSAFVRFAVIELLL